jgi:hypothetical protein
MFGDPVDFESAHPQNTSLKNYFLNQLAWFSLFLTE